MERGADEANPPSKLGRRHLLGATHVGYGTSGPRPPATTATVLPAPPYRENCADTPTLAVARLIVPARVGRRVGRPPQDRSRDETAGMLDWSSRVDVPCRAGGGVQGVREVREGASGAWWPGRAADSAYFGGGGGGEGGGDAGGG